MLRVNHLACAAISLALLTVGCGGSPLAPSPSGATISGRVSGGGTSGSRAFGHGGTMAATAASTLTVTVVGTNLTATVDASGSFQISGVPAGDVQLQFSDGVTTTTITISSVNSQELVELVIFLNNGAVEVISEVRTNGSVELCHKNDNGSYHLIEVSANAEPAHRAHGDGEVGDVVPADPTKVFSRQCRLVSPNVDIEVLTNGQDADEAPGPSVAVGSTVAWTYTVTNTGTLNLRNVRVVDDRGVAVNCNGRVTLNTGESMTCTASGVAVAGQYRNVGTVTADSNNGPFHDSDPSHYYGGVPATTDDGPRVQLCHRTGNGRYNLIEVSASAEPAHRGHGDARPYEAVPENPTRTFSASCTF